MASVLDLPAYVGQRSATFRFGLINAVTGEILEDLNPIRDSIPTITHDTTRTIKRQLTGLMLNVADAARVNSVQDRVLPYMVIGGIEYPLGRYAFSDDTKIVFSSGNLGAVTLLDEMYIIDQQIETSISAYSTLNVIGVSTLLQSVLNPLNVSYELEPTPYTTNGTWPIGTNRGNVLEDLSIDGDYFSPWFDNTNTLRFIRAFDPADALATFDWDVNKVVMLSGISKSSDLLDAPNRFIVISNSTTDSSQSAIPIIGVYNVPDSAPWSQANRGYVVPSVFDRPVDTVTQASSIATNIGQRQTVFERYELDTVPNPLHDSYDVITWQGEKWLELAWSLPLKEGEAMHHVLRRAFA